MIISSSRLLKYGLLVFWLSVSALLAEAPVIKSDLAVVAVLGASFEYEIEASNDPVAYSVAPLPEWLQRKDGKLYGTPVKAGETKLLISALNADGVSKAATLTILVQQEPSTRSTSESVADPELVTARRSDLAE